MFFIIFSAACLLLMWFDAFFYHIDKPDYTQELILKSDTIKSLRDELYNKKALVMEIEVEMPKHCYKHAINFKKRYNQTK